MTVMHKKKKNAVTDWLVFMLQGPTGLKEDETTVLFGTDDMKPHCWQRLTNRLYQPSKGEGLKLNKFQKPVAACYLLLSVYIYI